MNHAEAGHFVCPYRAIALHREGSTSQGGPRVHDPGVEKNRVPTPCTCPGVPLHTGLGLGALFFWPATSWCHICSTPFPPAAWLWKRKEDIIGKEINIRVGGSFIWPPTGVNPRDIKNVVFIAGGVGIKYVFSPLTNYLLA